MAVDKVPSENATFEQEETYGEHGAICVKRQREAGGVGVFTRDHSSRLPMRGGAGTSLAGEVAASSSLRSGAGNAHSVDSQIQL